LETSDIFMSQVEVARACGITSPYVASHIRRLRSPVVLVGGKRMLYTPDGEKLIEQIKAYYAEKGRVREVEHDLARAA
jgi:DNA-binding transcriptional LysR family regulator